MTASLHLSDRPAETDALGRFPFARSLAQSLVSVGSEDGLVIGIEGSWGTGKSTVIGFIRKHLTDAHDVDTQPVIVEFNPWMVSNTGAMVDALVSQIAVALHVTLGALEEKLKVGEKLLGYIGLIKHLKYLKYVPGIGFAGHIAEDAVGYAATIAEGVEGARKAAEDVEKLLPHLDLAKKKADVADALRKLNRSIVVIVDDLDRLPEDELRLVVQTIKAVADFPRTTYLLAYDRDIVASALGAGIPEKGRSYLEKIVQVAYPIPPLFRYQLRGFLDAKLQELFAAIGVELREYESTIYEECTHLVSRIVRHPRDVVRLMNRLWLSLPATRGEVNAIDVIVFEALSQRFPDVRDNVHRHPTEFIGQSFRGDYDDNQSRGKKVSSLIGAGARSKPDARQWERHLPPISSDSILAVEACAFLFEDVTKDKEGVPEDELRIADPDRLARFFRMTSLESVPEVTSIHDDLANPDSLEVSLSSISSAELGFLLEWICNYTPSCTKLNAYGSIEKLVNAAIHTEEKAELTSPLAELFANVLVRIMRRAASGERVRGLAYIADRAPLSVAEPLLLSAAAEQGKWIIRPQEKLLTDKQLVSESDAVDSALETWSNRIRKSAQDGQLANEPRLQSVLYRFAQLNFAYEETYKIVQGICTSDDGLRNFLSEFVSESPFNSPDTFGLIEDANAFAARVRDSAMRDDYAWVANLISSGDYPNAIAMQAKRLKGLRRADLDNAVAKSRIPV
ncbi:KAP family P-loop NTPase fold protein [Burkholderia cepacia]|uniref:KAP family P-loop NTPase fold protein n=1 Tax=Burkholderia cepacia TaxID=292 RepID=UPI003D67A6F8